MEKELFYTISAQNAGLTVERFLRRQGYSRALLVALKSAEDGLTIFGTRVFTIYRLSAGEVLRVHISETEGNLGITPMPMPLCIVYEDEDLLIVNKPAGMAVHPSQGNRETSLANAVAWLAASRREPFVFRAIGRLDKNTSGLVLLAKHALSACLLSERTAVRREYRAICEGLLPIHGLIDAPIGRAEGSTLRREVRPDGDRAVTHFERLGQSGGLSLVRVWLETGRTHQIRVHMAHIGCPLVGDFLYNPGSVLLPRHALHAGRLTLLQPLTNEPLCFSVPLPEDMSQLVSPRAE